MVQGLDEHTPCAEPHGAWTVLAFATNTSRLHFLLFKEHQANIYSCQPPKVQDSRAYSMLTLSDWDQVKRTMKRRNRRELKGQWGHATKWQKHIKECKDELLPQVTVETNRSAPHCHIGTLLVLPLSTSQQVPSGSSHINHCVFFPVPLEYISVKCFWFCV